MVKIFVFRRIFTLVILLATINGYSQNGSSSIHQPLTRILFVFDASQSMSATWGNTSRMAAARQILIELVDSLEYVENLEMALRVYGHQSPVPPQDCSDTRLEVAFAPANAGLIRQKLRAVVPKGTTPIANSLAQSANDFPPCGNCRNIIILITDGIEACGGDPCAVSLDLQKRGIALRPFVIGIGLDSGFRETFDCVGYYFNVHDQSRFHEVLDIVVAQVLNQTSSQVNLLDENGSPLETDVNMTFYDIISGQVRYNIIHTLNHLGNPDTLLLDHLTTYRLVVHTIPPIVKDSIVINPGTHTIINLNAPQGYLSIKTGSGRHYENIQFSLRKEGHSETLVNQRFGETGKLLTGRYEIELPIIPHRTIIGVEVFPNHTTTIEIPVPGTVSFHAATNVVGSIYQIEGTEQKWVYNLNPSAQSQSLQIQPGNYRVVFRNAANRGSAITIVKEFTVEPGRTLNVELF